jgi:PAS domain-containing protein
VLATGDSVYEHESLVPLLSDGILRDHYWTYSYSPVFGTHNRVVGVLDIAQDVTAVVLAKQADAARRETEERLWAFTDATNNALYQMSADWSVVYRLDGKSFLVDTANPDSDWLTKYIHPLDQPRVLEAIARAITLKSVFALEHRVLRADGDFGWTSSRALPILDKKSGEIRHWFGAATDITGRKQMEAALVQQEKLAAVGQLASTIAHEINNPLEAITNLLFLASEHAVGSDVQHWLAQAVAELRGGERDY